MTWNFVQEFLGDKKKILLKKDVNWISYVPKLNSCPCSEIWATVRRDSELSQYVPTDTVTYPSKEYLLNVEYFD